MAEWLTPKTDWKESDYFNIEDYNRIKNNIAYLKVFTDKLFSGFEWITAKNLIPYPYYQTTRTTNGMVFTDKGNGEIEATGNAAATAGTVGFILVQGLLLKKGITYALSGCPSGGAANRYRIRMFEGENTNDVCLLSDYGEGGRYTPEKDILVNIRIVVNNDVPLEGMVFRPQLERGAEITEFEVYHQTIPNASSELVSVDRDKTYSCVLYAREINNIETNLETLNLGTYDFGIGEKQVFKANGSTPLWSEFNRIESACLLLYKTLVVHKKALPRLDFTLGGEKGIRV